MRTENYYIEYRYIPGSLYRRDLAAARAAGNHDLAAKIEAQGDGGYGSLNNGASMRDALRYRRNALARLAALEANPCVQWAAPCGRWAADSASSHGYRPGETKPAHSFE